MQKIEKWNAVSVCIADLAIDCQDIAGTAAIDISPFKTDVLKQPKPGAQAALHFGGWQFSWTFIRWRHRVYSIVVQIFRKRSQITLFATFPKMITFLVLIRPVTMEAQRGEAPQKIFSPLLEKCVGYSLKTWAPPRKLFPPLVCQAGYGPGLNEDANQTISTE